MNHSDHSHRAEGDGVGRDMNIVFRLGACAALISLSTPALAGPKWVVQPIQAGEETVRYEKGVPTVDLEMKDGVVQITPLAMDHGSLAFGIAIYNDGRQPANFGVENISVAHGDGTVKVFTREELQKKAQNRAMWQTIALAAVGAMAAASAASQRNHYRSTFVTPRGTYRSYWSAPSVAGQIQATAIAAGTGVGIASIQNHLDETLRALGDEVVQLTTVDPGESYGGRIVIAKIKPKTLPARMSIEINWNGEQYPFSFQIAKPGTKAPVFTAITRASDLTDFRQLAEAPSVQIPSSATGPSLDAQSTAAQPASKVDPSPGKVDIPAGKAGAQGVSDPAAQTPVLAAPI